MASMNTQDQQKVIAAMPTTDGAGVRISRAIGTPQLRHLDPFLMLDHLSSSGQDHLAGFPDHPHRGINTLTYMLHGSMQHRDSMGHSDTVHAGGIQWMKAAHGVIHSEMPLADAGEMQGFQLWINLPAAEKLSAPAYQQHQAADLPHWHDSNGGQDWSMRLLLGRYDQHSSPLQDAHTDALVLDVQLGANQNLTLPWQSSHNGFAFCYRGAVNINHQDVSAQHLLPLSDTNNIVISSETPTRLLLAAGRPLREPIVQGGPFVMNTQAEIQQAINDHRNGVLTQISA